MNDKKQRASRLDPYAHELFKMEAKNLTLLQMMRWLAKRGVKISDTALSLFLRKHRRMRADERFADLLRSSAQECRAAEKVLDHNPAPSVETLVKLFRVLILKLVKDGSLEPKYLKLADQLARTAIRDRELAIEEAKFAETKKSDQIKALECCLDEAKAFPKVKAMYRAAFDALCDARSAVMAAPTRANGR